MYQATSPGSLDAIPGSSARRINVRRSDRMLALTDTVLRESTQSGSSHQDVLATVADLLYAATHDELTGLPTRGVLINRLEKELGRGASDATALALLFIDLDNFKLVNDSLGHQSGDELLRQMAQRILRCAGDGDLVSRFGGDELVVLHAKASNGSEAELASRVLAAMAEPFQIAGRELVTSVSIGVAICAPGAQSADQLLRDADTALYAAKSRGRNRMARFNEELHARVARRMRIEAELRSALRERQLQLHYQPQVNLATGQLVGVEALARWQHPELGWIAPAEFIPIAEESRLIGELGRQMMELACRQLAAWCSATPQRPLTMTVNVSPHQLDEPGFVAELQQIVEEAGIQPSLLCLELTESALMSRETDLVTVLERVRDMGIYVAIDDFGTEHSSLARLRDLPVEVLKIDRSFVDGLPNEPGDTAIVSSILSLAFAMGKHVIAEGVERVEQAMALRSMGCRVAQGYLFARPVAASFVQPMRERPLWEPPTNWNLLSAAASPDARSRRAHATFIDEFLDHIGAPMSGSSRSGS